MPELNLDTVPVRNHLLEVIARNSLIASYTLVILVDRDASGKTSVSCEVQDTQKALAIYDNLRPDPC